ncbi:MAG: U32 family peptidase [Oscillospiraceae bacterium]|jgi:putative protease|nr:U32 family peptidase [Oscillospiraceae bacterium]
MTLENKNKKPEILAPAGGMEQMIAAARSGADAVYLGTKLLNARRNAKNFTQEELLDAVGFCHERGIRLYVTMNTLVFDDELATVRDEVRFLAQAGVDAVIVQDFAVAKIVRDCAPTLPLHASTQMTIHNAAGAKAAAEFGFQRVVLARELTLAEIKEIRAQSDVELEVFVHGALCMSASGACYLSSMIGTRSGNRGQCAQPCRLNFQSGGREYVLSLKDLSALRHLKALRELGVSSFKIEGRMKRPEYVAMAVDSCRKALEGKDYDTGTLQAVFSRGGFTDGYLTGKRDSDMFGYRTEKDVSATSQVLSSISEFYRRDRQSVPVSMDLRINTQRRAELTVSDKVNTVTVFADAVLPEDNALTRESALKGLAKTGGTPYFVKDFTFQNPNSLFLFPGQIKAMRRDALKELSALRSAVKPYAFTPKSYTFQQKRPRKGREVRLRFRSYDQFFDPGQGHIILPVFEIEQHPECIDSLKSRLIAEVPELLFENEYKKLPNVLAELKAQGLQNAMAHNLSAVRLIKESGLAVFGGYGLNITNSLAAQVYSDMGVKDITLSFELAAKRIERLEGDVVRGILAYGYLPLMKFRNCPAKTAAGCGDCNGVTSLIDRRKITFPLICEHGYYGMLLNSVALFIADKPVDAVDFNTLYFTTETTQVCRQIYERFINAGMLSGKATTGLYYRTIE